MSQDNPYAPKDNNDSNPYAQQPADQQQPYGQAPAQPYGQAPAYNAQPYAQQPYGAPQQTSGLAIAALVTGLLGTGLIAIILGHLALRDVKNNNKSGRGMALAGTILGYVTAVFVILWFAFIFFAASQAPLTLTFRRTKSP